MSVEREAVEFTQMLQELYLRQRDTGKILDVADECASWIGTGVQEFFGNSQEVARALAADHKECSDGFDVVESQYKAIPLLQNTFLVYGQVHARAKEETALVAELYNRVTLVCTKTENGMKLLHLHASSPDSDQEGDEYFAKKQSKADKRALRGMLKKAMSELSDRNRTLEALMENVPGGVHRCRNDESFTLLDMSSGFLSMFGYTRAEIKLLFKNRYIDMIFPADREAVIHEKQKQLAVGASVEHEYRATCKDGSLRWILDNGRLLVEDDGTETFYCMLVDITDRKKEQEELRLSLERHQVIMNQATDIIFEWDIRKDAIIFSSNWEKKFGYLPLTRRISRMIPKSNNIHPDDMPAFIKIMKDTAAGIPYSETEFRIRNAAEAYTWCRIRATVQFDDDRVPIKAVGVIVDVDNEKKQKQVLIEMAQKDALTGLYNKNTIDAMVEERLRSRWGRSSNALMIIDVDHFKAINDTYGHLCGDAVLSDVASSIRAIFRSSDLVGRIGGDEFLVFLSDVGAREAVEKKAAEILEAVSHVAPMPGAAPILCSVGVVYSPQGSVDYYGLCQCADRALYYVKNTGRGGFVFYDADLCDDVLPGGHDHTVINASIDSERENLVDEKLVQYTFRMLYASVDIRTAITQILEIIGRAYDVSRAYIFESTEDGLACNNTFEWCGEGVTPEIDKLQNISYADDLGGFLANFDENGVFYCRDISKLHPDLYNVLAPQSIASVLQCAIREDGKFVGYVGFDECRTNRHWTKEQENSLTLTANVLSTFLLKLRMKEQLAKLSETAQDK